MKRVRWAIAVFAVFIFAAVVWAERVDATPQQDGLFLFTLGQHGLVYENASAVIALGKEVCTELQAGTSVENLTELIDAGTGLDRQGAAVFISASVSVYCQQRGDVTLPRRGGEAKERL